MVGVDNSAIATSLDYKIRELQTDVDALGSAIENIDVDVTIADVGVLQATLNGKASTVHRHAIADVTGLQIAIDGKASSVHTHSASKITNFNTAADARIAAAVGVSIASLSGGKTPTFQLPAIALMDVLVVASQAQLAFTAEEGDVAVRSDENKSYIHNGGTAGTMDDWN